MPPPPLPVRPPAAYIPSFVGRPLTPATAPPTMPTSTAVSIPTMSALEEEMEQLRRENEAEIAALNAEYNARKRKREEDAARGVEEPRGDRDGGSSETLA
jgi:hypothetical protein